MEHLEHQPQDGLLYKTGSEPGSLEDIREHQRGTRIKDAALTELAAAVKYVMWHVGIRKESAPMPSEKQAIVSYLRRYYGFYTCEEFKLAFELAAVGLLPIDEKEISAYQNFTNSYVSKIMRAYTAYVSGLTDFEERRHKEVPKALPPPQYNPKHMLDMYYQEFLLGTLKPQLMTDSIFSTAQDCGLKFDEIKLLELVANAKKQVLSEYGRQLQLIQETRKNIAEYQRVAALQRKLIDTGPGQACYNDDVNHRAKALCIVEWFGVQKAKGVKHIV